MTMQIVPTNWYSWDFKVTDESRAVAGITLSHWREKGALTIGDSQYGMYREAPMSGAFILERAGTVLARAEKPSLFRREFVVHFRDREYTLRPESLLRRAFVLTHDSQRVGSVAPNSAFTRRAAADLPEMLPLPVRMFIVWLTMISWRRQQNSSCSF
jgi:hypothetical protein